MKNKYNVTMPDQIQVVESQRGAPLLLNDGFSYTYINVSLMIFYQLYIIHTDYAERKRNSTSQETEERCIQK